MGDAAPKSGGVSPRVEPFILLSLTHKSAFLTFKKAISLTFCIVYFVFVEKNSKFAPLIMPARVGCCIVVATIGEAVG